MVFFFAFTYVLFVMHSFTLYWIEGFFFFLQVVRTPYLNYFKRIYWIILLKHSEVMDASGYVLSPCSNYTNLFLHFLAHLPWYGC